MPDLLLSGADGGVTVVDVKPPHKRSDGDVRSLMDWTANTVSLRGWGFEEWYGASPEVLANVTFLAGFRRSSVIEPSLVPVVREAAREHGSITGLVAAVGGFHPVLVRPVVLHLLWRGELAADLRCPLSGISRIWLSGFGTAA